MAPADLPPTSISSISQAARRPDASTARTSSPFEPTLSYDIRRVQGAGMLSNAGLFNCVFSGQGRIAITYQGQPGGAAGRPADLRRPAGCGVLVGIAADRLPPRRPVRSRHLDRAHHRRGVHNVVLRARASWSCSRPRKCPAPSSAAPAAASRPAAPVPRPAQILGNFLGR